MRQLLNLSSYAQDLAQFSSFPGGLSGFLQRYGLAGIELIQAPASERVCLPDCIVQGLHLPYWPTWLDFYHQRQTLLAQQFPDASCLEAYYGSCQPTILAQTWRRELVEAQQYGADYAVVHVCHNSFASCFTYAFDYEDPAVIDSFIHLINQATEGLPPHCLLLLENLWWPGLTLLRPDLAGRLLREIHYPKIGFMLDTGHLMNTNQKLRTEEQAVKYMLQVLDNFEPLVHHIKGIHLSSSLSGAYMEKTLGEYASRRFQTPAIDCAPADFHLTEDRQSPWLRPYQPPTDLESFLKVCRQCGQQAGKIDQHRPFLHKSIRQLVARIQPDYLVHELLADSLTTLENYIALQIGTLNQDKLPTRKPWI